MILVELNDRKLKILQAIVLDYLQTAEPVGSRTISKNYDVGVSSATIRNEMADLEELGLIVQPYTSAGRIPSDLGYRLYVDQLMKQIEYNGELFSEGLMAKADRIESLLQEIAKLLASQTNYATMVTTPQYKRNKLKRIQLVPVEEEKLLVVTILEGNVVKNHMISISSQVDEVGIANINNLINNNLHGLTLQDINLEMIQTLKMQVGEHKETLTKVLDAIAEAIQEVDDLDIYTSGSTNILKLPEFSDSQKAADLLDTLEEKKMLLSLIDDASSNQDKGIQIFIGNENSIESLQNCSFITTNYNFGGDNVGTIGILGPKRMDYAKVVSILNYIMKQFDKVWDNKT